MVLSDDEIKRLFRIRKTVMQMLKDRGYFVGDFEINLSKQQFISKYGENMKREDLVINKTKRNNNSDQVSLNCFSNFEPQVGFKSISKLLFLMYCTISMLSVCVSSHFWIGFECIVIWHVECFRTCYCCSWILISFHLWLSSMYWNMVSWMFKNFLFLNLGLYSSLFVDLLNYVF